MLEYAVQSVSHPTAHYILLVRERSHIPIMGWRKFDPILVPEVTEGAACTALLARDRIDNDRGLVIVNCDQYIDWDFHAFLTWAYSTGCDGAIVTMKETGTKWSFVATENGRVVRVAEKDPISDEATSGIYFWRRGSDFVKAAFRMVAANDRTNGEFYVAPTYNYLIASGGIVYPYRINNEQFHNMGTPEDLAVFRAWREHAAPLVTDHGQACVLEA